MHLFVSQVCLTPCKNNIVIYIFNLISVLYYQYCFLYVYKKLLFKIEHFYSSYYVITWFNVLHLLLMFIKMLDYFLINNACI